MQKKVLPAALMALLALSSLHSGEAQAAIRCKNLYKNVKINSTDVLRQTNPEIEVVVPRKTSQISDVFATDRIYFTDGSHITLRQLKAAVNATLLDHEPKTLYISY